MICSVPVGGVLDVVRRDLDVMLICLDVLGAVLLLSWLVETKVDVVVGLAEMTVLFLAEGIVSEAVELELAVGFAEVMTVLS